MKKNIFQKTIALLMVLTVSLSCMTFSAVAADDSSVMIVAVDGGETRNFTSFNDGWIYAMEQSLESHTTLTLLADWVATNGDFYCENAEGDEYGTHNGYLDFDANHILTIDLNGHKIDRNLDEVKDDGMVFSLTDQGIILTIKDSVGGGEITGGNNTGDGGAFYVYDGALFIEGGEITGNHARNGGGIYWYSDNVLCLTGGRISGNTAEGTGGGIHHEGDGGSIGENLDHVYLGGDVQIYGNSGAGSEKNNLYVDQYRFINLAAGQTPYAVGYTYNIPSVPFTKDALIGISAHKLLISVTPIECNFNYGDDKYFFSDNDKYSVRLDYEAKSERYNMYLDYKEKGDPVMSVTIDGAGEVLFTDAGAGWAYTTRQSSLKPATVKLLADWVATDGDFYCKDNIYGNECGSNDGYLYINDNNVITIDLNGHKIDRNLSTAKAEGMVFYLNDADAKLTIKDSVGGGKITGGNNTKDGGAFYVYNGSLYIEGGEITGNRAENGGGIYWYSDNTLCITGGKITGNTATDCGGGIYHQGDGSFIGSASDNVYLGGDVQICDNSGSGGENNIYIHNNRGVNLADGQSADIPNVPFREDATIGISMGLGTGTFSSDTSDFNYGDDKYFFSDSDEYSIGMDYNASTGRYRLYMAANAGASDNVMSVTVEGAGEILFTEHGKGWAYAMEQSLVKPTIVKLLADWVATDGKFYATKSNGSEYGTNNGRLYFNDDHVLVINLNGHKIDRNLDEAKSDGMVFYLNDTDIRLTIRDDAGGGKITGGNNTGNGGAFYVYDGGLFIRGGEITGNHAKNGGGIYWASENAFFMYHGRITGNTADENGGGIYHYGDGEMLTGAFDNMFFGGDVQIYGNSGAGYENNNLYVYGTKVINLTAGQRYSAEGYAYSIPNAPFKEGAVIGVTVSKGTGVFSARPNQFNLGDDKYFFSDSNKYSVRMDYDALDKCYRLSLADKTEASDAVMAVAIDGAETSTFTDFSQGWKYALEQSLDKHTTVKLLADWVAPNGEFYITSANGWQYGTSDGSLYLNQNFDITIDLNGHKIDRNLSEAKDHGMVFYLNNDDCKLTIKDSVGGGKITGGNNTGEGGAFHMDGGSLYIEGGEISGNKASTGAGIFAGSQNNLCVYGGKITGNIATVNGGGIYGDDWGPFYFGGSAVISGNTVNGAANNLYLEDDDVVIRRTAGQQNGLIPNVPFEDGASIGISTYVKNKTLLSGADSSFGYDDYTYFFSDDSAYGIHPIYDSGSSDATHKVKMYLDAKENINLPKITHAGLKTDNIRSVGFDPVKQVISVTAYNEYASILDSDFKKPSDVFHYTTNVECETVYDESFYWTNPNPIKMMLVTSDGTYGAFTVITKWVCSEPADEDNNHICDYCGEYITTSFAIPAYDAETLSATVITPEEGTYTVIFVDYEGSRLENVDVVNYEFSKGVNIVGQKILGFELGKGDKIMLVSGLITLRPLCEALVIE